MFLSFSEEIVNNEQKETSSVGDRETNEEFHHSGAFLPTKLCLKKIKSKLLCLLTFF